MTTLINLTPHDFTLCNSEGQVIRVIPPTKPAARVTSTFAVVGEVAGIPITKTTFGAVENLPDSEAGSEIAEPKVYYIVSLLVQQACPDRVDLLRPDTGPQNVVRDAAGQIVGVKALAR